MRSIIDTISSGIYKLYLDKTVSLVNSKFIKILISFSLHHFSDNLYSWNKHHEKTMNCGGGSSVRVNPIGVIFVCLVFIVLVYFNLGGSDSNAINPNDRLTYETVSLKAVLSVSIEIAKRGGLEVKKIREQVHLFFKL